jgi:hypothetical protein
VKFVFRPQIETFEVSCFFHCFKNELFLAHLTSIPTRTLHNSTITFTKQLPSLDKPLFCSISPVKSKLHCEFLCFYVLSHDIMIKILYNIKFFPSLLEKNETMKGGESICVIKKEFPFADLKINITSRSIHFPLITQTNFYNYFIWKNEETHAIVVSRMRSAALKLKLKRISD